MAEVRPQTSIPHGELRPASHEIVAEGRPTARTARGGTTTSRRTNGDVGPLRQMPARADLRPQMRTQVAPTGDEPHAPEAQRQPPRNGTNGTNSTNGPTALRARHAGWRLAALLRPRPRERHRTATTVRLHSFWPALVQFVHSQRYVLAEHVREHFSERLRSERSTNRHLHHLVQLGYLNTVGLRTGAPNNIPQVFYATGRGLRFVQQSYTEQGMAWTHGPSEEHKAKGKSVEHVLHEVLLSQFGSDLRLSVDARPDLQLLLNERRWFRHPLTFPWQGTVQRVVPDLGFVLAQEQPEGRRLQRLHFVELDLGGMSLPRWRAKLEAYRQWSESTAGEYLRALARHWGAGPAPLPWRLAIIAHDKLTGRDDARLRDLVLLALEQPAELRRNLWFTTVEDLDHHAEDKPPLNAPSWLWLKDASLFLDRLRRATARVPNGPGRRAAERHLLAQVLTALPRYTLLPPMPH